jgi:hypothetical protein
MRKRLRKKKAHINPVDAMLDIVMKVAYRQGITVDVDSFKRAKKDIKMIIKKGFIPQSYEMVSNGALDKSVIYSIEGIGFAKIDTNEILNDLRYIETNKPHVYIKNHPLPDYRITKGTATGPTHI